MYNKIIKGNDRDCGGECAFISDSQRRLSDKMTFRLRPRGNNGVSQPSLEKSAPGRRRNKFQWSEI